VCVCVRQRVQCACLCAFCLWLRAATCSKAVQQGWQQPLPACQLSGTAVCMVYELLGAVPTQNSCGMTHGGTLNLFALGPECLQSPTPYGRV
jgi:hypothetical protein